MKVEVLKCPHCDAPIKFKKYNKETQCEYCGQMVTRDRTELDDLQDISDRMNQHNVDMFNSIAGIFRKK